jgi:nuclear transport factor 2 (NTF2) superfamily protein
MTRDPSVVVNVYTPNSIWRNRDSFLTGHDAIKEFLTAKWAKETEYVLRKELFAFTDNKIAVQFWYEFKHAETGKWYRCYGLEDWTFNKEGKMEKRMMSGNDVEIEEGERWFVKGAKHVDEVDISSKHW